MSHWDLRFRNSTPSRETRYNESPGSNRIGSWADGRDPCESRTAEFGRSPHAESQPPPPHAPPLLIDSTPSPGPQTENQTRVRSCTQSGTTPFLRGGRSPCMSCTQSCPGWPRTQLGHRLGACWKCKVSGRSPADCLGVALQPDAQGVCAPRWVGGCGLRPPQGGGLEETRRQGRPFLCRKPVGNISDS